MSTSTVPMDRLAFSSASTSRISTSGIVAATSAAARLRLRSDESAFVPAAASADHAAEASLAAAAASAAAASSRRSAMSWQPCDCKVREGLAAHREKRAPDFTNLGAITAE